MQRLKPLLLLSSVLLLASCQTASPSKTATPSVATETPDQVSKVCTVLKPIYYSRQDTQLTKTQVQQLNAGIVQLCPQYAPVKK